MVLVLFSLSKLLLGVPPKQKCEGEIFGERGGKRIFDLIKSDKTLEVDCKRSLVCRTLEWGLV
jgi:hypothetical protein